MDLLLSYQHYRGVGIIKSHKFLLFWLQEEEENRLLLNAAVVSIHQPSPGLELALVLLNFFIHKEGSIFQAVLENDFL